MKVSELIEKLKEFDLELQVKFCGIDSYDHVEVRNISIEKDLEEIEIIPIGYID